jgi:hypothetical protein
MFTKLLRGGLNLFLGLLDAVLPKPKTLALAAAAEPTKSAAIPSIDVQAVAANIQAMKFEAAPVIAPTPPEVKIVSYVELPLPVTPADAAQAEPAAEIPEVLEIPVAIAAPEVLEIPVSEVAEILEITEIQVPESDIPTAGEPAVVLEVPVALEIAEVLEIPQSEIPTAGEPIATPEQIETTIVAANQAKTVEQLAQNIIMKRGDLVKSLLDEAWQQGYTTYANLAQYVEMHTGRACSKKVISAWKKERQLIEAA